MAVKERKCQEINASWINSSFMDSFGVKDNDDISDLNEDHEEISSKSKRMKMSTDETDNEDVIFIPNDSGNVRSNKDLRLWSDKYVPKSVDDLVVNKRKVSEVEGWLKDALRCDINNRYSGKVLLLTGPTGCGKTCTLNVLCKSLGVGIVEWITPLDIAQGYSEYNDGSFRRKSVVKMFEEFLLRATKYSSLLSNEPSKRVILIKDLPSNFLDTPSVFHEILRQHTVPENISPVVFIISCSDICRDLFPDDVKYQLNVTTINFNPVTEMSMLKALNRAVLLESKSNRSIAAVLSKPDLVDICQTTDGDLRSALLKLQFGIGGGDGHVFKVPTMDSNCKRTRIKKSTSKKGGAKQTVSEIDKDKKLDFFHSVGRVLYPKKDFKNGDRKEFTFVHSPSTIVDTFLTEPNKLVNILHENYLERFVNIKDVCIASEKLALTDLLFAPWEGKDVLVEYGLTVTVRGLMTVNTNPAETRWKPLSKSRIYGTETARKQNLDNARIIIPDPQSSKDALLDTIPYLTKLNISLPPEKSVIVKGLTTYKI